MSETNSHSSHELSKSVMEVAETESRAKAAIGKAEAQKLEIISNARKNAAETVSKAEIEAEEEREAAIAAERKKIESETKEMLDEAKSRSQQFKSKPFKQLASKLAAKLVAVKH